MDLSPPTAPPRCSRRYPLCSVFCVLCVLCAMCFMSCPVLYISYVDPHLLPAPPQAAQTNKQTADFLTTTYFLEPDLLGSPMPPPRLQHSSSAFSTPFSPVLPGPGAGAALGQDGRNGGQLDNRHNPATPRSVPAAPRKAERGYSWGNLQGSTALGPHPGLSMGSIISSSSSSSTPPSKSLQEVLAGYAPGSNR